MSKYILLKVENQYKLLGTKSIFEENPYKFIDNPVCVLCGPSGRGKTNCIFPFIQNQGHFDSILIFNGVSIKEPLYEKLKSDYKNVYLFEGFSEWNFMIDAYKSDPLFQNKKLLIIVDDFLGIDKKLLQKVADFSSVSRKLSGGCTFLVLTQLWTDCPKPIRDNAKYLVFFSGQHESSFKDLVRRLGTSLSPREVFKFYTDITEQSRIEDFLVMDLVTVHKNLRFRKGFDNNLCIDKSLPSSYEELQRDNYKRFNSR